MVELRIRIWKRDMGSEEWHLENDETTYDDEFEEIQIERVEEHTDKPIPEKLVLSTSD